MGLFDLFKKKEIIVPQQDLTECKKNNNCEIKPKSQLLLINCDSEVRARLLALANDGALIAEQWYEALYTVFSRSSHFAPVSYDMTRFNWLTKPMAFQSSTGVFLFGIDKYEDGDQWFVHAEEKNWSVSKHIITENSQKMCDEIALAIEEAVGIRLAWEIPDGAILSLDLRTKDAVC